MCAQFIILKHSSSFAKFIHLLFASTNMHASYDSLQSNISLFLNEIFGNILRIRLLFDLSEDLDKLLQILMYTEVSEEDFFEYFWKLAEISCIIFKTNIKIVFGSNKIHKLPFCSVSNLYDTDTLIGFDTITQEVLLLYILEDFHLGKFYLKNNSHITALTAEPRFCCPKI